jgi:hypothetical protein
MARLRLESQQQMRRLIILNLKTTPNLLSLSTAWKIIRLEGTFGLEPYVAYFPLVQLSVSICFGKFARSGL